MTSRTSLPVFLALLAGLFIQQTSTGQGYSSYAIRARVIDDLTREGVSTARVTITGTDIKVPMVVTTDAQGSLLLRGLSAGVFRLDIDKPGYFPQSYPDVLLAGAANSTAELKLGDLILTAQRNISGIVRWDDGEPMANAIIHVMTFRAGGYSRAAFIATVNSNERGEFRVEGLRARRYMVFAYQRPQIVAPGAAVRVALPVFYPGTDRPETAEVLDMRGTREVSGLTLTMKEERGLSIEGTVTAETLEAGSPAALGLIIPGVPTPVIVATETRIGDPFRLSPVPPGSYLLFAAGTPTARALPPGAPPNLIPPPEPIMTAVPITLDRDSPIRDLTVTLPAGTPIEGIVEVGENAKVSPATGVTLYFEWLPKIESPYGILSGVTNDKGEFHFPGAVKGQEYIPGPRSDWGPFYVASFKQGQQDLAAGGLPVIAGGDPVHVLLKGDGGRIEGRVRDGANTPWRAFVVVAPRDRRIEFWFRTGYTMSDGSFQIGNIPPGDYDIFAFDRNDEEAYYNADFLRRYGTSARPIRVEPYSVQLIDLSLTNTGK